MGKLSDIFDTITETADRLKSQIKVNTVYAARKITNSFDDDDDYEEEFGEDYSFCDTCGGPLPYCKDGCPLFDD